MIWLSDELAHLIEDAAASSLKEYGQWDDKSHNELLDRKFSNLGQLEYVGGFLPKGVKLTQNMLNESILRILVENAIIQTLLEGHPSYR